MGNLNKAVMLGNSNSGICKGRFRRAENGVLNGFVLEMYQCGLQLFLPLPNTRETLVTAAGAARIFSWLSLL